MHREIDHWTDQHEILRQSKHRLVHKYNHYAGVIIDMFYDHFLATHFDTYSQINLESFADNSYRILQNEITTFPIKAQNMLPYMVRGNWLVNYKEVAGIHRALQGISRRTKFDVNLQEAVIDLKRDYELYRDEFTTFFPLMIEHASNFKEELINSHL